MNTCAGCKRSFRTVQGLGLHWDWQRKKNGPCRFDVPSERARREDYRQMLADAVKYAREDGMVTPGSTRLARLLARAESAITKETL